MPMKSALKRSKSFGYQTSDEYVRILSVLDSDLSPDHQTLVRRALESPNTLVMTQVMEIVTIICSKATQKSSNCHPMAKMAMNIIDRDSGNTFIDSLVTCLREWFNERDKLLRHSSITRWTAYVSFVTELYLNIRCKHRHVKLLIANIDQDNDDNELQQFLVAKQFRSLAVLLYDCCQSIIASLAVSPSPTVDVECLQSVLRTVGRFMEEDNSSRMQQLMISIRDVFINAQRYKLTSMSQKSLLEVIEFRASKWQFSLSQQLYYFPYTKSVLELKND
ncbi:MIF4G domain-containing protein-like protein [Leptotrombidium deliense]|uniref:MIF4G domain-containing protein-like protein n=1 Tax=Leptotrombidium deliense TaxID=299467 RepID=A0A443SVW1_9ACAR|nr:MIF4G domain-containing protein-like protein [Leptotrombidium deliense]